jgi:hypothetical protein
MSSVAMGVGVGAAAGSFAADVTPSLFCKDAKVGATETTKMVSVVFVASSSSVLPDFSLASQFMLHRL